MQVFFIFQKISRHIIAIIINVYRKVCYMSPIFRCLICRKDIERSTKSYWNKKGHLLCSTCLDQMHEKYGKE
ncbi:hypothetical protein [Prochlorococcus marinus]|uniref:hypothetical protein n=1 Tax=Prochlorococcus sp. MIT 9311 TaxID=3082528 RepID=UPI00056A62BA